MFYRKKNIFQQALELIISGLFRGFPYKKILKILVPYSTKKNPVHYKLEIIILELLEYPLPLIKIIFTRQNLDQKDYFLPEDNTVPKHKPTLFFARKLLYISRIFKSGKIYVQNLLND